MSPNCFARIRLDLARALKQGRRLGGERMLLFTLCLTNNLFGTTLPQEEIICEIPFHPSMDRLIKAMLNGNFFIEVIAQHPMC